MPNERTKFYLMKYEFVQEHKSCGSFLYGARNSRRVLEYSFTSPDDYSAALEAEDNLKMFEDLFKRGGGKVSDFKILSLFELRDITSICNKEHIVC